MRERQTRRLSLCCAKRIRHSQSETSKLRITLTSRAFYKQQRNEISFSGDFTALEIEHKR